MFHVAIYGVGAFQDLLLSVLFIGSEAGCTEAARRLTVTTHKRIVVERHHEALRRQEELRAKREATT